MLLWYRNFGIVSLKISLLVCSTFWSRPVSAKPPTYTSISKNHQGCKHNIRGLLIKIPLGISFEAMVNSMAVQDEQSPSSLESEFLDYVGAAGYGEDEEVRTTHGTSHEDDTLTVQ